MWLSILFKCVSVTKSHLLSSKISPYKICEYATLEFFKSKSKLSASIRVIIESNLTFSLRSPPAKVIATGSGSASPVVSTIK